jgi:hypothetical protein
MEPNCTVFPSGHWKLFAKPFSTGFASANAASTAPAENRPASDSANGSQAFFKEIALAPQAGAAACP